MSKYNVVEEIPKRGDTVEITIESTRDNHLDEKYTWICEESKVTRIIKNNRGDIVAIRFKGILVKLIKVSRKKNCFYTKIGTRIFEVKLETIPE